MWLTNETTNAPSVARGGRMGMGSTVRGLIGLLRRISGRVRRTEIKRRQDVIKLSQREMLAEQIEQAKLQHRKVSHLHKQAYSITHDILRRGPHGR